MILKEVDEQATLDKYQKAGLSAERQMAFYLKRAFGDEENVLVINSLRLEKSVGDAAQIDHLVLHEFGMIIIESKSVSTKVAVNEHGEWARSFDGSAQGIPSPVKQAQRQADFLKSYLSPFTDILLKKVVGIQLKFDKMPIDLIVAISDRGIISRPKKQFEELNCIRKADQVVDKVKEIISKYRKEGAVLSLSLSLGPYYFGEKGRKDTSRFLLKKHKPYVPSPTPTAKKEPQPIQQKKNQVALESTSKNWPKCGKCNGNNVEVAYGRYGYYIKCKECDQNTAIKESCPSCKDKLRVRKQRKSFFLECGKCETSDLFHKNL